MADPADYAEARPPDAIVTASAVGIAAVERDTGISKETLRVWERRYGFPMPGRDAAGERLYSADQVLRLHLIKRLLDAGHRPGRIVAATSQDLTALLQPPARAARPEAADEAPEIAACAGLLQSHDIDGLRRALSQVLLRRGLASGVIEVFAPLTTRIGELWMGGALQVFEEHIFSECLQLVLRHAIQALPPSQERGPRVLLTTLPGESHALGLLMAEALLCLEGAACLSLGVQTPPAQMPGAVAAHRADVVALSFSNHLAPRAVLDGLAELRLLLAPEVEIWVGGGSRALRSPGLSAGVRRLDGLGAIAPATAGWRRLLESRS